MQNDVIGALPTGGPADSPLLRNFLIKRTVYNLLSTEDPQDYEARDDDTGAISEVLGWSGTFFWLDPDDTTSAHDGVTVIVTSDGYRYKVEDVNLRTRSVLSDTITSPPVSPAHGDAYLVPAGATGAWSSHQDDIAIYTRNGWRFEVPGIGKWLLIEDVDGFKRYTPGGWMYGPGARSFDDASVPLSAALGFGERIIVENQTTNTPPTATKGLRYIVGPSPTGTWLGKAKQIAICEVAGAWRFYPPGNGWAAFDKGSNNEFHFNGTSWVSSAGAIIGHDYVETKSSGSQTLDVAGPYYTTSSIVGPTTSNAFCRDDNGLTWTAKRVGAKLRLSYRFYHSPLGATTYDFGILRDSQSAAIAWTIGVPSSATVSLMQASFIITSTDTLPHTYKFALFYTSGTTGTLLFRMFQIEEFS